MCLICQFDRMHEKIDTKNEREKRRQQEISNRPNGKTSVQMMKIRNWPFHLKWGNHIKCVFSWIVFSHVRNIIWVLAHGIGQTNESIKCWMNARPALMTNEILHTHIEIKALVIGNTTKIFHSSFCDFGSFAENG